MNLLVSLFGAIILAAILLLGIGTGLLSNFFKNDLRKHLIISLIISLVIALIIIALSPFYESLIGLTVNNFFFYIFMAIIALVLGIFTFYYWEKNKQYDNLLKGLLYFDFIPVSYGLLLMSSAALSPSFVFDTANFSMTISTVHLAIIIAVLLIIISFIAYRFSDFIEDYRITHYPIIYGSMMVIFAFIFIVFGFLIPTIGKVLENPSTELTLMPLESGIVLIVILALLLGLGVLFRKRNNRLE
jgi:predicted transporter